MLLCTSGIVAGPATALAEARAEAADLSITIAGTTFDNSHQLEVVPSCPPTGSRAASRSVAKIGAEQDNLLRTLGTGELLALIAPCSTHGLYEGLLVLTNQRLMDLKSGHVRVQMALENVVRSNLGAHPGGFLILQFVGRNYVPYSAGMDKFAFAEHQRNHLQVNIQGAEVAQNVIGVVDGACGIRD